MTFYRPKQKVILPDCLKKHHHIQQRWTLTYMYMNQCLCTSENVDPKIKGVLCISLIRFPFFLSFFLSVRSFLTGMVLCTIFHRCHIYLRITPSGREWTNSFHSMNLSGNKYTQIFIESLIENSLWIMNLIWRNMICSPLQWTLSFIQIKLKRYSSERNALGESWSQSSTDEIKNYKTFCNVSALITKSSFNNFSMEEKRQTTLMHPIFGHALYLMFWDRDVRIFIRLYWCIQYIVFIDTNYKNINK